MDHAPPTAARELREFLRLLMLLRLVAATGQAITVWVVDRWLHIGLSVVAMYAVIATLALSTLAGAWRLRHGSRVSPLEVFAHLSLDLFALTALMYFSGGPANPFVSLYLVPVALAAVALAWRHLTALAVLASALYTGLLFWHRPMPQLHHHGGPGLDLHVTGMWVNFLISAALLVVFLGHMGRVIARQRARLADARERALRDESLLALGTLAAGTAHELNTPLATMTLLTEGWLEDGRSPEHEDVALLQRELLRCREHVRTLVEIARDAPIQQLQTAPAAAMIQRTVARWQLLRPGVEVHWATSNLSPQVQLRFDATLPQALANLLNNAADAAGERGHDSIEVEFEQTGGDLVVRILDRGPGPDRAAAVATGEAPASGRGLGLGLLISNASIERLGGRVRLFDRQGGGCVTEVALPILASAP